MFRISSFFKLKTEFKIQSADIFSAHNDPNVKKILFS
jgi:hypothetical protein